MSEQTQPLTECQFHVKGSVLREVSKVSSEGPRHARAELVGDDATNRPVHSRHNESEILVVCSANLCRSPVAAAFLELAVQDHDTVVRSAGLLADGRGTHEEVIRAAGEYGLTSAITEVDRSTRMILLTLTL